MLCFSNIVYSSSACYSNADCPYMEICQRGMCHLDCTKDSTVCADTMVCLAGGVCGIECENFVTCPYGTDCIQGKCETTVSCII